MQRWAACVTPPARSGAGQGQPLHGSTLEHHGPSSCHNGRFLLTSPNGLCSSSTLLPACLRGTGSLPRALLPADRALGNRRHDLPSQTLILHRRSPFTDAHLVLWGGEIKASVPPLLFVSPSHGALCCDQGVLAWRELPLSFRKQEGTAGNPPVECWEQPQHCTSPESILAMQQNLSISCCLFAHQRASALSPPSAGEEALG